MQRGQERADSRPRVVISNLFGDINRGGAAITAETIRIAQKAGARVSGISIYPDSPSITHPHTMAAFPEVQIDTAPLASCSGPVQGLRETLKSLFYLAFPWYPILPKALQNVVDSNVVISKGGYVFVDRPHLSALMAMWSTVYPLIFARRVGVPIMAFPTSFGPQKHRGSRWLSRWILTRMSVVFPRDPLSAQVARELGVPDAISMESPDIVLGMTPPSLQEIRSACENHGVTPNRFATITIRLNPGESRERGLAALAECGRIMLADEDIDQVLVVDQAGDDRESSDLAELLGVSCRIVGKDLSPTALVALYGGAKVTLSCRLHAAIFALVAGTPAISISITPPKTEGIYASLGLPMDWVVTLDRIESVYPVIADTLDAPSLSRGEILAAVDAAAKKLDILEIKLRETLHDSH